MSEKTATQLTETEFDTLALAYDHQIKAIMDHAQRAFSIFLWPMTLLFAVIGYVLSQSSQLNAQDRAILAVAVMILSTVTFFWQRQNRLESIDHAENLARLDKVLHLTESGHFGIQEPVIAKKLHLLEPAWRSQYGLSQYNMALIAMTIVVLVVLVGI